MKQAIIAAVLLHFSAPAFASSIFTISLLQDGTNEITQLMYRDVPPAECAEALFKMAAIDTNQLVLVKVGPNVPTRRLLEQMKSIYKHGFRQILLCAQDGPALTMGLQYTSFYEEPPPLSYEEWIKAGNVPEPLPSLSPPPNINSVEQAVPGYPPQGVGSPEP